jgi:hypothetical protein
MQVVCKLVQDYAPDQNWCCSVLVPQLGLGPGYIKNQTWWVYMGQDLQPQDLTWVTALTQELDLTWEKLGLDRLGPKPGLGVLRPILQFLRVRSRHGVGQKRMQPPS